MRRRPPLDLAASVDVADSDVPSAAGSGAGAPAGSDSAADVPADSDADTSAGAGSDADTDSAADSDTAAGALVSVVDTDLVPGPPVGSDTAAGLGLGLDAGPSLELITTSVIVFNASSLANNVSNEFFRSFDLSSVGISPFWDISVYTYSQYYISPILRINLITRFNACEWNAISS